MVTKNRNNPHKPKSKKNDVLRRAEYYDMQDTFDELFADSMEGKTFDRLMDLILSRENILLAYRNIKGNDGSHTPGTDGLTIKDVEKFTPEGMVNKVKNIVANYRPRAVRRKEIPKSGNPSKTRPLGIPCIWDRLIQQCVLQVLEPICEARFSDNSYGFRPNRSCEHAVAHCYRLMQQDNLHFVVEVDIKSFFDEVNHSKLIKQMWSLGIRDKKLIYIVKQILTAQIQMPDGNRVTPTKGTPQGGILSPLLANIVLNELDRWVESQWQDMPVANKYVSIRKDGRVDKSNGLAAMRTKNLKEMRIVRYADDFRIFCRTKRAAIRTKIAVTQWVEERLKLEVSPEKTRVVNLKKQNSEFLGIEMKVRQKGDKLVVKSHICDKAKSKITREVKKRLQAIATPKGDKGEFEATMAHAAYVMGVHNYYRMATHVSEDFRKIAFATKRTARSRLRKRVTRHSESPTLRAVVERYGKSSQIRFISDNPIAPIGYVQTKPPMCKKRSIQKYTPEGRAAIHDNLGMNTSLMLELMRQPLYDKSTQLADNRISLYCAQNGKCSVTGRVFRSTNEIHCHHINPKELGGGDEYLNLTLTLPDVHILVHATDAKIIGQYLQALNLTNGQKSKLNKLRKKAKRDPIA